MNIDIDGINDIKIIIKNNKNTYLRLDNECNLVITTNRHTSNREIIKLINNNRDKIEEMVKVISKRANNNSGFFYLGKRYDIVKVSYTTISIGEDKVFIGEDFDIDKFYKDKAKVLFLERLNYYYNNFSRSIPYPKLRIRKMKSRWGVCNTKTHVITLNLELMKRDIKYLDYVIVHELSHLVYADHSSGFWGVVSENIGDYKKYRKEMKEFL